MQRFIRMTTEEATAALKPAFHDGKWRRPLISKRQAADLRKKAIRNGLYGTWKQGKGGWISPWESMNEHVVMRAPKQHAIARNREARIAKIQANLADMPRKIEEHKKAMKEAKPLKGLDKWLNDKSL